MPSGKGISQQSRATQIGIVSEAFSYDIAARLLELMRYVLGLAL